MNLTHHMKRTKDVNHMITSIDAEKALHKIKLLLIIINPKAGIVAYTTMWWEDCELEASLGYIARLCLKGNKTKQNTNHNKTK
jgi:hypothetical protein